MADLVRPGAVTEGSLNTDAMPKNVDLEIYRGDYVDITLTFKNQVGAAINLTGYTPKAQLKVDYYDPAPVDFTCTITDAANGKARMYLPSTTTANLLPGSYIYDFQMTLAADTRTYITGDVTVRDDITR